MIAVIGDVMLDEYIYGSPTRMSPECDTAPVIVINPPITSIGGATDAVGVLLVGTAGLVDGNIGSLVS